MAAGVYNIIVEQGSSFAQKITVKTDGTPKNLTGYSARAQIRPTRTSATLTATFSCTVNPPSGEVLMNLSPDQTTGIAPGRYFYDLELYTSGDTVVSRILQGEVTVSPEVTR